MEGEGIVYEVPMQVAEVMDCGRLIVGLDVLDVTLSIITCTRNDYQMNFSAFCTLGCLMRVPP